MTNQSTEKFDSVSIREQLGGPQSDNPFDPQSDAEFFGGFFFGQAGPVTSPDQEQIWLIDDHSVRAINVDGEVLFQLETSGRAELHIDADTGSFFVVDNHSVYAFGPDGNQVGFVGDQVDRPEIVQGEGGRVWIIGNNDVVYLDESGKVLRHIKNTGGRAQVVRPVGRGRRAGVR